MEWLTTILDKYLDKGLGTVSFILLIGVGIYGLTTLKPLLKVLVEQTNTSEMLIKSSTKAVEEITHSNANVAAALTILTTTLEGQNQLLNSAFIDIKTIHAEVLKISERTTGCIHKNN